MYGIARHGERGQRQQKGANYGSVHVVNLPFENRRSVPSSDNA
jgi:hypothetical protein